MKTTFFAIAAAATLAACTVTPQTESTVSPTFTLAPSISTTTGSATAASYLDSAVRTATSPPICPRMPDARL